MVCAWSRISLENRPIILAFWVAKSDTRLDSGRTKFMRPFRVVLSRPNTFALLIFFPIPTKVLFALDKIWWHWFSWIRVISARTWYQIVNQLGRLHFSPIKCTRQLEMLIFFRQLIRHISILIMVVQTDASLDNPCRIFFKRILTRFGDSVAGWHLWTFIFEFNLGCIFVTVVTRSGQVSLTNHSEVSRRSLPCAILCAFQLAFGRSECRLCGIRAWSWVW